MKDYDDAPYIVIERSSGSFGAFFWGALLGAGVALLYAPRAGRETREGIRSGAFRIRSSAEEAVRQVQETITGTVEDMRRQVTGRIDTARDALDAGKRAAQQTRSDMERRIREGRSAVDAGVRAAREPRGTSTGYTPPPGTPGSAGTIPPAPPVPPAGSTPTSDLGDGSPGV